MTPNVYAERFDVVRAALLLVERSYALDCGDERDDEIVALEHDVDVAAAALVRAGLDIDARRGRVFEVLRSYSHDPELLELVPRLLEVI